MKRVTFSRDGDAAAVVAALRIAGEVYLKDADAVKDSDASEPAKTRLESQFRQQAKRAHEIATTIEREET